MARWRGCNAATSRPRLWQSRGRRPRSPGRTWSRVTWGSAAFRSGHDRIPFGRQVRRGLGSWQPWIADLAGVARPTWFALAAPFGRTRPTPAAAPPEGHLAARGPLT